MYDEVNYEVAATEGRRDRGVGGGRVEGLLQV